MTVFSRNYSDLGLLAMEIGEVGPYSWGLGPTRTVRNEESVNIHYSIFPEEMNHIYTPEIF